MKNIAYYDLIRTVHDKVPSYISFLLMVKLDFTDNIIFYAFSFFLRFNGILILCGNFQLSQREVKENVSLSKYLRYLTCYFILSSAKITNLIYIIISLIIFVLFCIRMSLYYHVIINLSTKKNLPKIKLTKYQIFMDHFVFLFYPYIIEFLTQIYFSYIFNDIYIFKRNMSKIINIFILIINTFLLIAYNINNYYYLHVINRPLCDRNVPVKYRYSRRKFWTILLLQNVVIFESLDFYLLTDKELKIYTYSYFSIFGLIFLIFFWMSSNKFNYDTFTNHFVSILTGFCFFSILSEAIVRILDYEIKIVYTLIIFNTLKIIISSYFEYLNAKMCNKKLYQMAKIELFKINKGKISNELIYDVFLYIFDVLKNIKKLKKNVSSINLLNIIYEHLNICNSNNCKCRLIQILPSGEQYKNNFTENLIKRIGFLIESAFAQNDFSEDYNLTLVLCEHFCLFKENPIMAYSLLQTLLYFNFNVLTMEQLLILYETCQKYIESSLSFSWHKAFVDRYSQEHKLNFEQKEDMVSINVLKEKKFRETFLIYSKVKKIQSMMTNYSKIAIDIMKQKNVLEGTVKVIKSEESGEVNKVEFQYLSTDNIEKLIKTLRKENETHYQLLEQIEDLKISKLPIEFYYKIFLFFEIFYDGKIDEALLPTFYSFTNDHNLYSTNINPNIYILLKQRFIDLNKNGFSSHYCIFKYCEGLTISYFSEPLSQELGYYKEDLINNNINILLPTDLAKPHDNLMLHYLITEQNRIFPTINNRMFNKKGMSINSLVTGASLPGLGKYLLIIANIELIENSNDLFFYYNSNLELISISNNNYSLMKLDLNLISTCKLDLLSIYNIDENKLKQKLNHFKPLLDEFKYVYDIESEEFFTKKLFRQSNKNRTEKFKLIEEIENHQSEEEKNVVNVKEKTIKTQKILEAIYNNENKKKLKFPEIKFSTIKTKVIENLEKYLIDNENIDINDGSYSRLSEYINLFRNSSNKLLDKNLNYHAIDDILNISIKIEILYDTPFLSVKVQEKIIYDKLQHHDLISHKGTKTNLKPPSYNRSIETGQKSITMRTQTSSTIVNNKILNIQNKFKENKTKCEKFISQIIFTLLLCIFIIYIIILVYQLNVINNLKIIFMAFYYNYIQRDKLVNLYSILIHGYFSYVNIVNYSEYITLEEYKNYVIDVANSYSSSFHTFYQNYVDYRFVLGKDLSPLYESFNVSRIAVYWDVYTISTNYLKEAENIVYVSILGSNDDNNDNIYNDAKNFFKSSFLNLTIKEKSIKSAYIRVLYYLCSNYQGPYSTFFRTIQNEIKNNFNLYSIKTKTIYISIETLGLIMNALIIITVIYFLLQTNKVIFKNLVNVFIDFTQDGEYNFKNNYDNFIVIEKLKQLQFLLNNFSLKAIDKYNKRLNYNSIDLFRDFSQDISNESFVSSDNKNNKNSQQEAKSKTKSKSNEKTLNNTNNKSTTLLNSKTNNEFLNDRDLNIIAKLNQAMKKKKDANMSSNQSLLSLSNLNLSVKNVNNINKKEEENKFLTAETIIDKIKTNDLKKIKIDFRISLGIISCVIIYFIIKIIITINNLNNFSRLFEVYSVLTFEFSKVINYLNNLQLLLINPNLGREYILDNMTEEVEAQFLKENKVKADSLKYYKKANDLIQALNRDQNDNSVTNFEEVLCETNQYCRTVLNSKYNIVNNGVDIALRAMIQVITNYYNDFQKLRKEINSFDYINEHFTTFKYRQVDLSLNYLLSLVEDRSAAAFLLEINDLIKNFDSTIISLDIVIIVFIFISSIFIVFVIITNLLDLADLVQKSTSRINKATSYIKIQNVST